MTASAEERASRRYKEMLAKGMQVDLKQLQSDIEARDKQDCERKIAPLCCAEDAIFWIVPICLFRKLLLKF